MRGPFRAGIAMLAGVAGLAVAAPALAATNQPIAQTGGAEATFMIAGVPMTVNVALDVTTGDITSVSVDPNTGLTATADSPTKVKFESADGTTKVSVKAKKNSLSMGVKTASLKDLLGSNSWTGDLFGTGSKTTVKYTIGDDGTGAPTFAFDGTPAPADGSTATVLGMWNGSAGHDDDDSDSAGGRVAFDLKGFRKTLTIAVFVSHETDDATASGSASLRVTLQGRDIQSLPLADLVAAPHAWAGVLCDGTKASINFKVNADGSITIVDTTPADATTNPSRHGVLVKFATGDKVSIQLFNPTSGNASLKIDRKGRECNGTRVTAPDPSVNTPVSTTVPGDRKHGGDKGDKHGTTTTTAAGTPAPANAAGANGGRTGGGHGGHGGGNGGNG